MISKKIRNIVIELTSLLDVVMILIFAVMIENTNLATNLKNELDKTKAENEALQGEYIKLSEELQDALSKLDEGDLDSILEQLSKDESRLDAYDHLDEAVEILNVSLERRSRDGTRVIIYGYGVNDASSVRVEISKTDKDKWQSEINKFRVFIDDHIEKIVDENKDKVICIVFTADNDKVYSNDYKDIKDSIYEIMNKNEGASIYTNL